MIDDHNRCEWVNVSWYWLTRIIPDKIQRAVKWLCVCVVVVAVDLAKGRASDM